jgi:hypothetical protein
LVVGWKGVDALSNIVFFLLALDDLLDSRRLLEPCLLFPSLPKTPYMAPELFVRDDEEMRGTLSLLSSSSEFSLLSPDFAVLGRFPPSLTVSCDLNGFE